MSNLPAPIDSDLMVGMEDFDESDVVMPTLSIAHKEGVFVDGLSGETYAELDVILLGLVKGRILWPAEMGAQKEAPLCKSYNFDQGCPSDRFPWKASGFNPADYGDNAVLPCEGCKLKDWGSNPKTDAPWCAEQHQYVALLPVGGDNWSPAVLTVQRTGLKPSRAYMTGFSRAKEPLFITQTHLSLRQEKKGSVEYCVPKFARSTPTDPADYQSYADTYRRIRQFLQTPRVEAETDAATSPAPAAPAASSSGRASDDDLPF